MAAPASPRRPETNPPPCKPPQKAISAVFLTWHDKHVAAGLCPRLQTGTWGFAACPGERCIPSPRPPAGPPVSWGGDTAHPGAHPGDRGVPASGPSIGLNGAAQNWSPNSGKLLAVLGGRLPLAAGGRQGRVPGTGGGKQCGKGVRPGVGGQHPSLMGVEMVGGRNGGGQHPNVCMVGDGGGRTASQCGGEGRPGWGGSTPVGVEISGTTGSAPQRGWGE